MRVRITVVLLFLLSPAAIGAPLRIPSTAGPLTIDGVPDEPLWQPALALPFRAPEFGVAFQDGGEARIVLRGGYVCVSARVPEPDRVVARSTGANPTWWREDLIVWEFRTRAPKGGNRVFSLSVNPLGAWRVEFSGSAGTAGSAMAAARVGQREWTVEAAIDARELAELGFLRAERIRVPRPQMPELRWMWPGSNDRAAFEMPAVTMGAAPLHRPAPLGGIGADSAEPAAQPSDPLTADLETVPSRVWSDDERKRLGVPQMVEKKLLARIAQAAADERRDWEKVRTLSDWEAFRNRRLGLLKASLGPFPERTPLRAAVTRRADFGYGFAVENVVYESRPGLMVTANLYLPSKIADPIPAIVVVHSHHAPKVQSELQDMGMTWARNGTAVLVMDQLGAGERLQSQPWSRESYYSRYALGMQLHLAGESLMKWMVWDLMRGIDLLLERGYIDPRRIVMLGAVAGGGDPAAVTAALDERIAAVIPFNFGEAGPEEHYTEGPRPYDFETAYPGFGYWETTRNLNRSIGDQFFPWFICASVAPRAFLYSFEIGWPNGVEKQPPWPRYRKVFELYGKSDRLAEVDGFGPFPGPGECTNAGVYLRKKIYPILERWLGIAVPPAEFHSPLPEKELMCLTPQAAVERSPKTGAEIAQGMARQRLDASRTRFASLPAGERFRELRAALRAKLGDIDPPQQPAAKTVWTKGRPGLAMEAVAIDTEPGIMIPLLLLKPAASTGRLPVVLALSQAGKGAFLAGRGGELRTLLRAGIAVCLPDVRGTGEAAWTSSRGPSAMTLAANEMMLGGTMLAGQIKDVRAVLAWLSGRADVDRTRMALWGESFAGMNPSGPMLDQSAMQQPDPQVPMQAEPLGGLLALMTALYEDGVQGVAVRRELDSYLSVLADRFCYVPQDAIVPGILEIADLPDIAAALGPRGVRLEAPVDGRNRAASVETKAESSLAEWLSDRLRAR